MATSSKAAKPGAKVKAPAKKKAAAKRKRTPVATKAEAKRVLPVSFDQITAYRKALASTGLIEYHSDSASYLGKGEHGEALADLYNKLADIHDRF